MSLPSTQEVTAIAASSASVLTAPTVLEPQVLLILVGLPGSGKTTFVDALVRAASEPQWATLPSSSRASPTASPILRRRRWVRASQDDAPSRRRQEVESFVRDSLEAGYNVAVDRVDFDRAQRAHFIEIAYSFSSRPQIHALILPVTLSTLTNRLQIRTSHPTIPDASTAMRVLSQMTPLFQPPKPEDCEGFDRIYTLPEERQAPGGLWGLEDVKQVIDSVEKDGVGDFGARKEGRKSRNRNGDGSEHGYLPFVSRGGYRGRRGYGPREIAFGNVIYQHSSYSGGGQGGYRGAHRGVYRGSSGEQIRYSSGYGVQQGYQEGYQGYQGRRGNTGPYRGLYEQRGGGSQGI